MTTPIRAGTWATHVRHVQARDWHELPAGHYALPVHEFLDDEELDAEPELLGYATYRRAVRTTTSTGRRWGGDSFTVGALWALPGIDPDRLGECVSERRAAEIRLYGPHGDIQSALDDLLFDLRRDDQARAQFGKITGKCGYCGRALSDATSKLLGIGPDCRGTRHSTRRYEGRALRLLPVSHQREPSIASGFPTGIEAFSGTNTTTDRKSAV